MPTKILAIDDSKTMRLAIKITFAAEDAEVTSVSKGGDAVARAKQVGADIVIVDHRLGGAEPSGYDICKALKADAGTSGVPVILLVSNQSGADHAAISSAGADGWLAKPFDTQELIDKVADLVTGKGARPAASSGGAKPIASPPAAGPAAATPARPAAAAARPAATPAVPRPASKSAVAPASPARPAATPAAAAAPRATARTQMGMPTPIPKTPPAATGPRADGAIPIAIPIPFTAASAPSASMLARLQAAAGSAGVDPKVAEAIANLSREVIERVVWEVVPELAESIIKKESQARTA